MKLEVLISCMHQTDLSIIERSNIQTDVLVVNQCDEDKYEEFFFKNKHGKECFARIINTTERGLSRSRNMAIKNAIGDICLICDDDEVLENNYEQVILNAFASSKNTDIIAFKLNYFKKKFGDTPCRIGRFLSGRISSVQIAFWRTRILSTGILFDEKMGSGSGNGAGEENKFLFQLISHGMNMMYQPLLIATIKDNESLWFDGYTNKYFIDKGWAIHRIYGSFWGYIYIWYHLIKHYNLYKNSLSLNSMLVYLHKGFFTKK